MPLAMAPIPCSRTPYRTLRSAGVSFWKSPNCFIKVMLDGARSAEPPMKPGWHHPRALSMVWEWMRVGDAGLSSGVNVGERVGPAGGELTGDDGVELLVILRVLGLVRGELLPFGLRGLTLLGAVHVLGDGFRDLELAVLPVEVLAGRLGLVGAEGRAVHVVGVGLVRGTVPDQGGHLDERRAWVLLGLA